jgi:hypothetical protein
VRRSVASPLSLPKQQLFPSAAARLPSLLLLLLLQAAARHLPTAKAMTLLIWTTFEQPLPPAITRPFQ